jgi:hypothetical protein
MEQPAQTLAHSFRIPLASPRGLYPSRDLKQRQAFLGETTEIIGNHPAF